MRALLLALALAAQAGAQDLPAGARAFLRWQRDAAGSAGAAQTAWVDLSAGALPEAAAAARRLAREPGGAADAERFLFEVAAADPARAAEALEAGRAWLERHPAADPRARAAVEAGVGFLAAETRRRARVAAAASRALPALLTGLLLAGAFTGLVAVATRRS